MELSESLRGPLQGPVVKPCDRQETYEAPLGLQERAVSLWLYERPIAEVACFGCSNNSGNSAAAAEAGSSTTAAATLAGATTACVSSLLPWQSTPVGEEYCQDVLQLLHSVYQQDAQPTARKQSSSTCMASKDGTG